jgi:hypothetical protein
MNEPDDKASGEVFEQSLLFYFSFLTANRKLLPAF